MKTISTLLITGILLFLNSIPAFSQYPDRMTALAIEPYYLTIAFSKTTNLVFPYAIKSVDRGSNDVLAQKAGAVENILQIKAAAEDFKETNLTVITAEGKLYSFMLNFEEHPMVLNLVFENRDSATPTSSILSDSPNESKIENYADVAAHEKKTVSGIKDKKHGIKFSLDGLFIHDDAMYYRIKIENRSNINYDIDQLRFFIRDRKRAKRTATQEVEINPLHINNVVEMIKGQSEQYMVYALPKFTIPDKKYLTVQLMEQHGGRHLELKIHNKTLVRSTVLSTIKN